MFRPPNTTEPNRSVDYLRSEKQVSKSHTVKQTRSETCTKYDDARKILYLAQSSSAWQAQTGAPSCNGLQKHKHIS